MNYVLTAAIGLFFTVSIWMGRITLDASYQAMTVWWTVLVPSLLIPTVCLRMMRSYHVIDVWLSRLPDLTWLRINANTYCYLIWGWLLGFPNFAVILDEDVCQGRLDEASAKRLLLSISSCTIPFAVLTLGVAQLDDLAKGCLLWLVQLLSNVILLVATRQIPLHAVAPRSATPAFIPTLKHHIAAVGTTLFYIGGYMLICMVALDYAAPVLPHAWLVQLAPIVEFSSGLLRAIPVWIQTPLALPLISAGLGFGGLCVHAQNYAFLQHIRLPYRQYLCARSFQAVLCFLLMMLLQFLL